MHETGQQEHSPKSLVNLSQLIPEGSDPQDRTHSTVAIYARCSSKEKGKRTAGDTAVLHLSAQTLCILDPDDVSKSLNLAIAGIVVTLICFDCSQICILAQ